MAHAHDHEASARTGRAFGISVTVNTVFIVVEVAIGLLGGSVSLVADAAHNAMDVLGLVLAWGAARLAARKPSSRRTYGLKRASILASLANAVILLAAVGATAWEAIGQLRTTAHPDGGTMAVVAFVGVLVNGGSALLFVRGMKQDINVRGAFLHLAADALVSLAVVAAGIVISITGWGFVDPLLSLVVSLVIMLGTWSLLRRSIDLALDAVPEGIDPDAVRRWLVEAPGVLGVHDLHIWATSTTETALTAHLVVERRVALSQVRAGLESRFDIHHTTLQLEDEGERCSGC